MLTANRSILDHIAAFLIEKDDHRKEIYGDPA